MMSSSRITSSSSLPILTSVPEYLPKRILSPTLTSSGRDLAVFQDLAVTHGDDFALDRFFFGGVGDDDATG